MSGVFPKGFSPYANNAVSTGKGTATVSGAGGGVGILGGSMGIAAAGTGIGTATYANSYVHGAKIDTDLVISRSNGNKIKVAEAIEEIQARLLIIQPNFEKMTKYPALKAAYDNYKLIESLIGNGDDTEGNDSGV